MSDAGCPMFSALLHLVRKAQISNHDASGLKTSSANLQLLTVTDYCLLFCSLANKNVREN